MSIQWDLYNTRLTIDGATQRDRIINNFKKQKSIYGVNSPSCKTVLVEDENNEFKEMQLFINSKSDKTKKSISPVFDDDKLILGNKIKWKDCYWLVTELNLDDDVFIDGLMQQCNYILPFQTTSLQIYYEPCIVSSQSNVSGEDAGNIITVPDTQRVIYVQYNENTKYLVEGKRIFIDNNIEKPKVYKITNVDRIGYMHDSNGLWKIICEEDVVSTNDNIELKIADYISDNQDSVSNSTENGKAYIVNTKGQTYTENVKIKIGNIKPFVAVFKDESENIVTSVIPKWNLIIDENIKDKIYLTFNDSYPDRCYVNIDYDNSLIGTTFVLQLIDTEEKYGEFNLTCEVTSLYG